jgi:Concanavalin A-like lectin/glucanases superfamily/Secretion system C-terminal sorting domain/The GLUG motif
MKKTPIILCFVVLSVLFANSSLEFDGLNDHVRISSAMNIGNGSNTVEAWIKVPLIGTNNLQATDRVGIIMGNYDISPNAGWEIHDDGQLRMWWNKNSGGYEFYGTKDLRDNAWHHIAFVRDVSLDSSFMYVDGVLDASYQSAGPNLTFTTSFYIGADRRVSLSPYFHGRMDELRVWNTARTQTEIREYMCENVSGSTGLLAYYQMSNDSGTSLTDNTGNGYTGTLTYMDNSDWVNDNQIPVGDGSATPYQINGLNQLYWLSQNSAYWSADVDQITDITATATESWDGGAGFTPIGNSSTYFTGTYDGNDYSINDLTINRVSIYNVALFGGVRDNGIISRTHVKNVNISGDYNVGGIVGYLMQGNISTCSSTGSISGKRYSGGIAGAMNSGTISECFTSATINLLPGRDGDGMGGLTGYSYGSVRDCYASGQVNGGTRVGGLIGYAANNTLTSNCYSTGSVSGTSYVGGLIGRAAPEDDFFGDPAAVVTGCFWDTEASENAISDAGTGKTTSEMKTLSTYTNAGWDFADEIVNGSNDYWGINNAQHDGYPFLSWENYTHNYSDTPLPVTLTSFQAASIRGVVELSWVTESESENLGYILERKKNNSTWEVIANYMNDPELIGCGTTSRSHEYAYSDVNVIVGHSYEYRLSDVSESNEINELRVINITVDALDALAPKVFGLKSTYPNPFNPTLSIRYGLTEDAQTKVNILDLQGKIITTLGNEYQKAGDYELRWHAADAPSGIYFVKIMSGEKVDLKKVMLTK